MDDLHCAEPTVPERARTVLAASPTAALATLDVDGRPVVGVVPIVDDGTGAPITVLSNLSRHTIRARQDGRAGMTIGDRLLIQGDLVAVPGLQQLELQERFLENHPQLRNQVESLDYSWLRLVPLRVCFTGDWGEDHWLPIEDLAGAKPDPLAKLAEGLVESVADRLGQDLVLMARTLGGRWLATTAKLMQIDRYGLLVEATDPSGTRMTRLPFSSQLEAPSEVHLAVGGLLRSARAAPSASSGSPSLLHPIKGDSGRRADIDRIDSSRHGDSNSLFDSLERANGQSWALGSEKDGDPLVWIENQVGEIDGINSWSESQGPETELFDDVDPGWERFEPGVWEDEGFTHADAGAATVKRIATAWVEEEGVDAEGSATAQDDAHVSGVVDGLGHNDGPNSLVNQNFPGVGDRPSVEAG